MHIFCFSALDTIQEEVTKICDNLSVNAAFCKIINVSSDQQTIAVHLLVPQGFLKAHNAESRINLDIVMCQLREPVLPPYIGTLS